MSIRNLIILSQLNPPAHRSRVLSRSRVNQKMQQSINYPLTILEAGTGYGKSTSILSFVTSQGDPVYWFTISGTERDPKLFLAKLFTAFNQHNHPIGDEPLKILDIPDAKFDEALIAFINAVTIHITQDAFLILDDFHLVCDVPDVIRYMNWIIEHLPPKLHVILYFSKFICTIGVRKS